MSTVLAPAPDPKSTIELKALRAIDYDWTMHLRSVWSDPPFDSPEIHTQLRQEFQNRLDEFTSTADTNSPIGWLVVGSSGSGKTHWLSICRQQAVARQISFVLVDMTDVRSFWDTVLQGYLDSLQQEYVAGKFQQQVLTERFLQTVGLREPVETALRKLRDYPRERLAHNIDAVLAVIQARYPQSIRHHDVIRALLAMVSHEAGVAAAGFSWLSANPVDEDCRKLLGFIRAQEQPLEIVKALSWMMSLCGPTVLAFDQLDPIVAQLDPAAQAEGRELDVEGLRALSIIQEIANGLSAMHNVTYRTLTLACCLETTLNVLRKYANKSWQARFHDAVSLTPIKSADAAASVLYPRVLAGCQSVDFNPPSQIWPLSRSALNEVDGQTPRELLKICESHRQRCIRADVVLEMSTLKPVEEPKRSLPVVDVALDTEFEHHRQAANVAMLFEESTKNERMAPILIAACRCLLREITLPDTVDAVVDDFAGGKTTKPLHARIRLIDHGANDREIHYCFRAIEQENANAFQARLKAVMNSSGIDQRLPFRHSTIMRFQPRPRGEITEKLVAQYGDRGGCWHKPTDEEVRTLFALKQLIDADPPGLENWLKGRKPASRLALFVNSCPQFFKPWESSREKMPSADKTVKPFDRQTTTTSKTATTSGSKSPKRQQHVAPPALSYIPLGQRQIGTKSETVQLPLQLLEKHTVVLAGAGSGKTVLLKRMIEEAALAGIPSIVIDGANDLASLGEEWPDVPSQWLPGDSEKAQQFLDNTDLIWWTPGREDGNHLVFEPLPDMAAVAADPQELQLTIDTAVDVLAAMTISGKRETAEIKRAILARALRFFAGQGQGNLRDFCELLSSLPAEASRGISNEARLAKQMADVLISKMETNAMLRGTGTGLDPAILFGDAKKLKSGPRISIVSLIGLPSPELRQQFIYQLGMTLFTWIKRNPHPSGRALRGLLIIDEAKDFVPSVKEIPSKVSIQLLASQARKYHLGLILATQNPKEIENRVVGNCATQFYGRASSRNAQEVIQELVKACGGQADDIGRLIAGQFYAFNPEADLKRPEKLKTPMCLSRHRTLTDEEILHLAAKSREALAKAT